MKNAILLFFSLSLSRLRHTVNCANALRNAFSFSESMFLVLLPFASVFMSLNFSFMLVEGLDHSRRDLSTLNENSQSDDVFE